MPKQSVFLLFVLCRCIFGLSEKVLFFICSPYVFSPRFFSQLEICPKLVCPRKIHGIAVVPGSPGVATRFRRFVVCQSGRTEHAEEGWGSRGSGSLDKAAVRHLKTRETLIPWGHKDMAIHPIDASKTMSNAHSHTMSVVVLCATLLLRALAPSSIPTELCTQAAHCNAQERPWPCSGKASWAPSPARPRHSRLRRKNNSVAIHANRVLGPCCLEGPFYIRYSCFAL